MVLDEVITDVPSLVRAAQAGGMEAINLKIARVGGLTHAKLLRDLAQALGIRVTVEDMWGGDIVTAAGNVYAINSAGVITENGVDAFRHLRSRVFVASRALGELHLLGMRICLYPGVTIGATQSGVHAVFEFGSVDVQAATGRRFHTGLAMADQAVLIGGREWMGKAQACD
jgi:hypothetical protein